MASFRNLRTCGAHEGSLLEQFDELESGGAELALESRDLTALVASSAAELAPKAVWVRARSISS